MIQLIPYQTAAHTATHEFFLEDVDSALVIDIASTFAGAETITLHFVGHDGVRSTPVLDSAGAAVVISATSKHFVITHPCKLKLVKGVTAQAMGVNLCSRQ